MIKTIAVVGLGSIAQRHRRNLKTLFPQTKIIALPSRLRNVAEKIEDADLVIADIDTLISEKPYFVIIASPASFHLNHAKPLIEKGIPLLIEKPVCAEYKDAQALLALSEKYQTPIAVGYCLRYLPSALVMKGLLESNKVGSVYNVFINVGQFLPDWRANINYQQSVSASQHLGGGVLLELSHELDYARWLFGDFNVEQAILRGTQELELDVEAFADISLRNKSSTLLHMHLDFLQKQCQRNCSVIGTHGRLDWDLLSNTITYHHATASETLYTQPDWDKNQMYLAMIKDFSALLDNSASNIVTLQEAVETVALITDIKSQGKWGGVV